MSTAGRTGLRLCPLRPTPRRDRVPAPKSVCGIRPFPRGLGPRCCGAWSSRKVPEACLSPGHRPERMARRGSVRKWAPRAGGQGQAPSLPAGPGAPAQPSGQTGTAGHGLQAGDPAQLLLPADPPSCGPRAPHPVPCCGPVTSGTPTQLRDEGLPGLDMSGPQRAGPDVRWRMCDIPQSKQVTPGSHPSSANPFARH